ncbi:SMI1/KNR4 family protein [Prescottella agglutinans]|uniref:SMI1/KNR4 family protein n=1 Tax=Prescottella agglutinans TaxID=1644129 RepID=UPI00247413CD|nr:SMI1/KNR4 family protein [Prescottella agglutinans]
MLDDWQTIEEGTVASIVAGLPPLHLSGLRVTELAALEQLPKGLYRLRVSVRDRTSVEVDPQALVQIWPVEERDPIRVWKWTDGMDIQTVYSEARELVIPRRRGHGVPAATAEIRPRNATPPSDVLRQWQRIASAYAARGGAEGLPRFFAPGASVREIDAAESQTGVRWPQELKDLYAIQNGFAPGMWLQLLPEHDLLSLSDLVQLHREAPNDYESADIPESQPSEADRRGDAGTAGGTHLPDFVIFAYRDGRELFCDTRAGELTGCITEYAREDTDSRGPIWASISAMLTDTADAIETGKPFDNRWIPHVSENGLAWRLIG